MPKAHKKEPKQNNPKKIKKVTAKRKRISQKQEQSKMKGNAEIQTKQTVGK